MLHKHITAVTDSLFIHVYSKKHAALWAHFVVCAISTSYLCSPSSTPPPKTKNGKPSAPSWSQTWEGSSLGSVWWPGLAPWGSAVHSPKKTKRSRHLVGPPPAGIDIGVGCNASRATGQGGDLGVLTPCGAD